MEEKDHARDSGSSKENGRQLSNGSHLYENNLNGTEDRVKKDVELENGEHLERDDSIRSFEKIP